VASESVAAEVIETLPNSGYAVRLESGRRLVCHVAGKMRTNVVRIIPGDKVRVEVSELDTNRGRIVALDRDR